jgi:hypothetical protein
VGIRLGVAAAMAVQSGAPIAEARRLRREKECVMDTL